MYDNFIAMSRLKIENHFTIFMEYKFVIKRWVYIVLDSVALEFSTPTYLPHMDGEEEDEQKC